MAPFPEFEAALPLDGAQRAEGDILFWVRHRYAPALGRMFELLVRTLLGDFEPSVRLDRRDDVRALHVYQCTFDMPLRQVQNAH